MTTGELIGAIAMTEPGTGSDLQAISTYALKDGDDYIINGSKTFITMVSWVTLSSWHVKPTVKKGRQGCR